jgi:dTDP-4-dehydrorhamnose reductase
MPKRVLVTGASGMLGRSLLPVLREDGFDVVAHGHAARMDVAADLTDEAASHAMLDQLAPEAIVNLVALTNVDRCEEQPNEAYRLNVRTVEVIASWIERHRPCELIQISTDQVYDGSGPHREADVTITNMYGISKYAGELAALRAGGTIVRTNFFGRSLLPGRPSFSDWLTTKLRTREPFTGFDDVLFSPVSMATLARMLVHVLAAPRSGVFNLGSRDGISKAAFAEALARHFDLDASAMRHGSSRDMKLKAYRPGDMRMDCSSFEVAFGVALPSLQNEIERLERGDASAQQ